MKQTRHRLNVIRFVIFTTLFFLSFRPLYAEDLPPYEVNYPLRYTVTPGDTLVQIANRFGTTVHKLMQQNNLQSPAHIFTGQVLEIVPPLMGMLGPPDYLLLPYGSSLLDVSHSSRVNWEELALANRILNPNTVIPGFGILVPGEVHKTKKSQAQTELPTAVSVIEGVPLWSVLGLNPYPMLGGESINVPAIDFITNTGFFPHPLLELAVHDQPFIRGTTAVFTFAVQKPVTCTLSFPDQLVPCYLEEAGNKDNLRYTALVGVSPLLDPGGYTATISLRSEEADPAIVTVPLLVASGRYDYERIDLPADRTALLDPALSQAERVKIAALREVQTEEKLWSLPFDLPLPGSVTSFYGSRRSYGYGFTSFHGGTDFRAEIGVPVYAPAGGTVALAETLIVRGNAVIIDHGWGIMSGYWHLSRIDVELGQRINRGELIGAVGNTGLSTGPHLHWEMWVNGISVSPLAWTEYQDMTSQNQ